MQRLTKRSDTIIAIFKILKTAYPTSFISKKGEDLEEMIDLYSESLDKQNERDVLLAVRSLVKETKYIPSIKLIIDTCEKIKTESMLNVIDKMIQDNYFKSEEEISKAENFVKKRIFPAWFIRDFNKYDENDILTKYGITEKQKNT